MSERLANKGSVFALSVFLVVSVGLGAGDEDFQQMAPDSILWAATEGVDLPIPAPGSEGVMTPFFSWPVASGAVSQFYLGFDPHTLDRVTTLEATQNWYIHGPGLIPGIKYYWRVDQVSPGGEIITGVVWEFTTRGLSAQGPRPRDGQFHVSQELELSWTPGLTAFQQDLYLGRDAHAVAQADTGWPEYQHRLTASNSLFEPPSLDPNTTYFWRVDTIEVNGTLHLGAVWSFTTWPHFEVSDPNLKAWWRFDEGRGYTVLDWSGHEHHCTFDHGQWVPGRTGSALAFNRMVSPVEGPAHDLPVGDAAFTLALWMWPRNWQPDQSLLWWGQALPGMANGLLFHDSYIQHTFGEDGYGVYLGASLGEWVHVTVTHRGQGLRRIFLNGTPQGGVLEGTLTQPRVAPGSVCIGGLSWPETDMNFRGVLDEIRIYDRALVETEIQDLVYGNALKPVRPYPRDRSVVDVDQATYLSWQPLRGIKQQELFLGASRDQVLRAESDTPGIYQGTLRGSQFIPPEPLELGRRYYWRVDTQLGSNAWIRGDLWRFSVADYLIVDDFESYSDAPSKLIFLTWHDGLGYDDPSNGFPSNGSGSTVGHLDKPYTEQDVVYSGSQSLPFYYDNTKEGYYSQMDRGFEPAQDWTQRGIRELQLHFAGDPNNIVQEADHLYVQLTDQAGSEHRVRFTEPGLESMLQSRAWQLWSIPLSQFSQHDLDLERITNLSVGVGDPVSSQPGGTGIVYFDTFHLAVD